jgi:hypothetical protein
MSLEMAHKVILPPKKNYIPQFLKQRDINSYFPFISGLYQFTRAVGFDHKYKNNKQMIQKEGRPSHQDQDP